jgi:three-Cys-motif partner protein
MAKDNRNFFVAKKVWSEVKDELLGCYLVPYFAKLLATSKPILYVDCFAGKGKFDDGKDGSPLIALKAISDCMSRSTYGGQVTPYFIELNHAEALRSNTTQYSIAKIVEGRFEYNIVKILNGKTSSNVFLYIDPYGIKALDCSLFDSIGKAFNTAEILINLNSFGFIREACRALGVSFREQERDILSDLEEYDTSVMMQSEKSISDLDVIAGGEYWQQIVIDYKSGKLKDCYEAEKEFSALYKHG